MKKKNDLLLQQFEANKLNEKKSTKIIGGVAQEDSCWICTQDQSGSDDRQVDDSLCC